MSDENESCDGCKYWSGLGNDTGFCRRYPPTVATEGVEGTFFPVTSMGLWCGEFQPLPPTGRLAKIVHDSYKGATTPEANT